MDILWVQSGQVDMLKLLSSGIRTFVDDLMREMGKVDFLLK